ncbi:peptidoglycan/LPS O-acetylase OafA/YrhL [Polaromonas sp. CG_9.5]|uniref:acyltransferase family protein n=1 Tax=Polaromonas sp. CG_9.5 TaxID=3071705 RepID=UPI002E06C9BE|nr:peptidoglycan/LPS O-acetylase OafA/YrhL [Polaromonas sp. CG_9.5]
MVNDAVSSSRFRADINGLRAWAVVAVIFYHFGLPGFGGGFSGVDVFFVISGFLMTGIVVAGLERGDGGFSLWAFYLARARRILPALIALCAVLLALGWFFLLPLEYKALGTQVVFSLAFLSNEKFWREAGYFDTASHEKWLLHTWSLSVEWQFYLLLPLVLLALWKWRPGRKPLTILMVVGLAASLALSIVLTPLRPTAAFYLLPTRAWEMLAGGLVYLLAPLLSLTPRQRAWVEAIGFGLILATLFGFDASAQWPGWRALLPVTGAALVLLAARNASLWTAHPVAQWLGTRSYSLYLWHWPLVVALVYAERQTDPVAIAAGLIATLVLGQLSYALVETPARLGLGRFQLNTGGAVLAALIVMVAVPGGLVWMKDGVLGRFSSEIEMVSQEALNKNPRMEECHPSTGVKSPLCVYGGSNLRAIVMGDSHASGVVSAVVAATLRSDDGVMEWTYSGCPTLQGAHRVSDKERQCAEFFDWSVENLKSVPPDIPLIVLNNFTTYVIGYDGPWVEKNNKPAVYFNEVYETTSPAFLTEFTKHLTDTVCQLAKNRPVYLVRPTPGMAVDVPTTMSRAMMFGGVRDISISLADYHQRHAFIWAAQDTARNQCGVKILDPLPYLCPDGRCHGAKNGRPLYFDSHHLSEYGNKLLVPMFAEVFRPEIPKISTKSALSPVPAGASSY